MEEIVALLMHGGELRVDGAEGVGAVLGSETAGDFLFDLGHANSLLGEVVGERDVISCGVHCTDHAYKAVRDTVYSRRG